MKTYWDHSAAFAWVVLILVLAAVIGKLYQQGGEINARSRENRQLILRVQDNAVGIRQLRIAQADSCRNYLVLRNAVNRFHGTMISLLRTAAARIAAVYAKTHSQTDKVAERNYKRLLGSLHTVKRTCAQKR